MYTYMCARACVCVCVQVPQKQPHKQSTRPETKLGGVLAECQRISFGGEHWLDTLRCAGKAVQPAEIQFAQRLASHEKDIRDRAVKKLRQYLSVKTQKETGGRRRSAAHMAAGRGSPGWAVLGGAPNGQVYAL